MNNDEKMLINAHAAMSWLAKRCDWATLSDGQGFSGIDTKLGHALAEKDEWSEREKTAAVGMIVKYKKQLRISGIDITEFDELHKQYKSRTDHTRLRVNNIVTGSIKVDQSKNEIVIETSYNEDIIAEIRALIDRRWDNDKKQWRCMLCTENAIEVERIASEYGLKLIRHNGWKNLASIRLIEINNDVLLINGVIASQITRPCFIQTGVPLEDEQEFSAITQVSQSSVSIPLRSWVIQNAIKWLTSDKCKYIDWARDEAISLLENEYSTVIENETLFSNHASTLCVSDLDIINISKLIPDGLSSKLMSHQWVPIKSIIDQPQILLADQQGLGKTAEILVALEATKAFPAVIVVPATALINWRNEAHAWLPHRKVCILGGGVTKKEQGELIEHADILIINYESFEKYSDKFSAIKPKGFVADEAQYLKGYDSVRTKAIKLFLKNIISIERIVCATGTPVLNSPSELLTLLTLLPKILNALGGFKFFAARYCKAQKRKMGSIEFWDYHGSGNLDELANHLRRTGCFIRRIKADVLPNLKQKQIQEVMVEISNRDEYLQASSDFSEWLKTKNNDKHSKYQSYRSDNCDPIDELSEMDEVASSFGWTDDDINNIHLNQIDRHEALRRTGVLRHLTGIGKIEAAVDWINNNVKGEKLVVFAFHIEVQKALLNALVNAGYETLSITGDMAVSARSTAINNFQTDSKYKIIVCSLKAAQTAITLTAARRALIVELDWTPAGMEQAEDRIHRIGQNRDVIITYLTARNSLDERMINILKRKRQTVDCILLQEKTTSEVIVIPIEKHGLKKDGTPRKRAPGPGRPPLDENLRIERRKTSQQAWTEKNSNDMREYMRKRRMENKKPQ